MKKNLVIESCESIVESFVKGLAILLRWHRDFKVAPSKWGKDILINSSAARQCIDAPVLKRSLIVSIVVGTLLCAINQGDAILAGQTPVIWKVVLTYIVPFCVATYGAYSACVVHSQMNAADPPVTDDN